MNCKICNNKTEVIFSKIVLQKYNVNYYQCTNCNFVQTDEPFWLNEAYQSAITSLDIGLLYRNIHLQKEIPKILHCCFPEAKIMLDYAGGYGVFVRLMRDSGYDFYRQDDYCENIFAKNFDIENTKNETFDLVTAFEVFEHFNNPLSEISKIFKYSNNLILTTELIPDERTEIENWWYIAQETGQHIAFYSKKSMEMIAEKFNLNYYQLDRTLHIFTPETLTKQQLECEQVKYVLKKKYFGLKTKKVAKEINIDKESLLGSDYEMIKKILNSKN